MKLQNKQKVSRIVMKPKAVCFCPLGDDWYTNEFRVDFIPLDYFPDYCDVEKYLDENVRGKSLIIEDATKMLYDFLKDEYEPDYLEVTSYVNDVTSHSPVEVTIG